MIAYSQNPQTLEIRSKSQDVKKAVKKEATQTPKEKKELKRLKKAGKN